MNAGRLGVTDDHGALHDTARRWVEHHVTREVPRTWLDGGSGDEPPIPDDWYALAVDFGLPEVGVVLEELGRACAPGSFLPTVAASAAVDALGADVRADGPASLAWGVPPLAVSNAGRLTGAVAAVPAAATVHWLLLPVDGDRWAVVDTAADGVTVTPRPSTDQTRPVADVRFDGAPAAQLLEDPTGLVVDIAVRLWSAEAVGVAAWCVETAAAYACVREQFGQPIGKFQAVKHRCADMLCALELARASTWDALAAGTDVDPTERHLATATAAALAPGAAVDCAKDCIQVLGGIGFTWEHDAHLYLRRALATAALVGPSRRWRAEVARRAAQGARRPLTVDLPESDDRRGEIRAFAIDLTSQPKAEWRRVLAEGGWIAPHWPEPWGRDASPLEQLLIAEELRAAGIRRPHLQVGAWALPTLIAHGTAEQQERWIPPTLRGDVHWCQLFSEPGAGSDLAALATKASRIDGGWLLTGQKVWTSMAATADLGLCLARTDPTTPKREGITCFVVDMRSDGIDIRPLRELTGAELFNEVFMADVFVPDDAVVGPVGGGWAAARTTLANERVSMGSGSSFGLGPELVLALLGDLDAADAVDVDAVGRLLVDAQAIAALGLRLTLRALSTSRSAAAQPPGPEASVRKLVGVEHDQRVQETGLGLVGRSALATDGDAAAWIHGFLANRCLSIAGGTSEIQRNVIAERLLGLPRDAE
jgi:alkylation response protein AidB-like acyl-CoA dehydrogenase